MEKAKEGRVSTKPLDGVMAKMRSYKPKDAIFIPTGGLYLFQNERSQLMAVTTDGRYTITGGSVMDILQRKSVLSVEDVRKSYFINLDDVPFPLETVASIPLGNPKLKRQAAIFITLDCDGCQDLIKKFLTMNVAPLLGERHRFAAPMACWYSVPFYTLRHVYSAPRKVAVHH